MKAKNFVFFSTLIPGGMEDSQELESALRLMKLNGGYVMILCIDCEMNIKEMSIFDFLFVQPFPNY